jgi:hypothetical protein
MPPAGVQEVDTSIDVERDFRASNRDVTWLREADCPKFRDLWPD